MTHFGSFMKINKRLNDLYFSNAINCYKIHFVSYLWLHKKNMAGLYNLKHNFQWPNSHLTLCSILSPSFPSFLLSFPFIFLSNRLFSEQWVLVWLWNSVRNDFIMRGKTGWAIYCELGMFTLDTESRAFDAVCSLSAPTAVLFRMFWWKKQKN